MFYNLAYLNHRQIFTSNELNELSALSKEYFQKYGENHHFLDFVNLDDIGINFVYSSARLEGNSYNLLETLTLLKMGQTAGGKSFSDAVMILNLRDSFNLLIKNINNQVLNM